MGGTIRFDAIPAANAVRMVICVDGLAVAQADLPKATAEGALHQLLAAVSALDLPAPTRREEA